jgi:RNA polymerase sigma-70 factor (ECF subfamily)
MGFDLHTAEDLTQDIFGKVFEKLDEYDPRYRFTTWIYRIARNRCIDCMRTRRKEEFLPDETVVPSGSATPEELAVSGDFESAVERFLAGKDDTSRTVIYLRFYERMKVGEIADILSIPDGTVKSRLSSLKAELRKALEDYR